MYKKRIEKVLQLTYTEPYCNHPLIDKMRLALQDAISTGGVEWVGSVGGVDNDSSRGFGPTGGKYRSKSGLVAIVDDNQSPEPVTILVDGDWWEMCELLGEQPRPFWCKNHVCYINARTMIREY